MEVSSRGNRGTSTSRRTHCDSTRDPPFAVLTCHATLLGVEVSSGRGEPVADIQWAAWLKSVRSHRPGSPVSVPPPSRGGGQRASHVLTGTSTNLTAASRAEGLCQRRAAGAPTAYLAPLIIEGSQSVRSSEMHSTAAGCPLQRAFAAPTSTAPSTT